MRYLIVITVLFYTSTLSAICQLDPLNTSYRLVSDNGSYPREEVFSKKMRESKNNSTLELQFEFKLFSAETETPKGLVFIFPTINSLSFLERGVASSLIKNNFDALIILPRQEIYSTDQTLAYQFDRELARAICAADLMRGEMQDKDRWRDTPLFLFGWSQGGVRAQLFSSHLLTQGTPLKAIALGVAAGNLAGVYAYSRQREVRSYQSRLKQELNATTQDELYLALKDALQIDIVEKARQFSAENIWAMTSLTDTLVPARYQRELHEVLRPSHWERSILSHRFTIFKMYLTRQRVLRFFQQSLAE